MKQSIESPLILEIAVFNVSSALQAQKSGADRIELCENPFDGGTTPSYGTLCSLVEQLRIPAFPIIRPRGGDFLYSVEEFDVMKKDLLLCKQLGYAGAVLGLLNQDGSVDVSRTSQLVDLAYPLEITFHRAFDRAKDPIQSLKDIIETGCCRVLTSGQVPVVDKALPLIKTLVEIAGDSIIILPGSGVRSTNLLKIMQTGATEFHSSARLALDSKMEFHIDSMEESLTNMFVDTVEIEKMKSILRSVISSN